MFKSGPTFRSVVIKVRDPLPLRNNRPKCLAHVRRSTSVGPRHALKLDSRNIRKLVVEARLTSQL